MAGLVGFSLGTGAAYVLEYLDKTIKTTSDVERIFNLPVIGYISEIPDEGSKATYVSKNPDSVLAENFRLLCSNIGFFRISNPIKTILITSPSQGAGKTTVASNLAWSIAQDQADVVLVDADLRRPAVHTSLEITKNPGLADVIREKADLNSVIRPWNGEGCLKVITAGSIPAKIAEVAGSKRLSAILSELKENYELVIIDAPPLIIADSYNLASTADGVIIVMEPGETSDEQARAIKEQLIRADAKIVGIVFNKISDVGPNTYYDSQYRSLYSSKYYGDYHSRVIKEPTTGSRSEQLLNFFEYGKLRFKKNVGNTENSGKKESTSLLNRFRKPKDQL
jgi:capsular exopolysaccharide synthesis family protein